MAAAVKVEVILLDGIQTVKLSRGAYLIGYLRSTGWVGQAPSQCDLADVDLADLL